MEEQLESTMMDENKRKAVWDKDYQDQLDHKNELEAKIAKDNLTLARLGRATKNTIHDTNSSGHSVAFDIDLSMEKLNEIIERIYRDV